MIHGQLHAPDALSSGKFRYSMQKAGWASALGWTIVENISALVYEGVVPVAVRSKARVCGRLLARIVGSSPAGDMDVCLL